MLELAKQSNEVRNGVFSNTAVKLAMSPTIIEKDFWVCVMLNIIFHHSDYKTSFCFKGGTSLSKGFHAIERFSEDIDLIMDWRLLEYSRTEPWDERSNTQQVKFNKEANQKAVSFLRDKFMPHLKELTSQYVDGDFSFEMAPDEEPTIIFNYPRLYERNKSVLQEIRLEIGPLAAWTPTMTKPITPYVAEVYPGSFKNKSTAILMVESKRTFWEKVTILHKEAHRTKNKTPQRYSRHYYDVYMLFNHDDHHEMLDDTELLYKVVEFKKKFYRDNSAEYDDAIPSKIQLLPNQTQLKNLEDDYESMKEMFFSEPISFDIILKGLSELTSEIRSLS